MLLIIIAIDIFYMQKVFAAPGNINLDRFRHYKIQTSIVNSPTSLTSTQDNADILELPTVAEVIANETKLSKLKELSEETEWKYKLEQSRHITILLPTNDAFESSQIHLNKYPYAKRMAILYNHVIPEIIKLPELTSTQKFLTMAGSNITFQIPSPDKNAKKISDQRRNVRRRTAPLTSTDYYRVNDIIINPVYIQTFNGIAYYINKLLMPPESTINAQIDPVHSSMTTATFPSQHVVTDDVPSYIKDTNLVYDQLWNVDPPQPQFTILPPQQTTPYNNLVTNSNGVIPNDVQYTSSDVTTSVDGNTNSNISGSENIPNIENINNTADNSSQFLPVVNLEEDYTNNTTDRSEDDEEDEKHQRIFLPHRRTRSIQLFQSNLGNIRHKDITNNEKFKDLNLRLGTARNNILPIFKSRSVITNKT